MAEGHGRKRKVWLVCEVGIAHGGDLLLATQLMDLAQRNGADAVKFQYYDANDLVAADDESNQASEIRKSQLSLDALAALKKRADKRDLRFFATPFIRPNYVDDLVGLGVEWIKIRERDSDKRELVNRAMQTGKKVLLSSQVPISTYNSKTVVMYCLPAYPPKLGDLHLEVLRNSGFAGFSCHHPDWRVGYAAAAIGLSHCEEFYVEVHFTHDHRWRFPDQAVCLDPYDLRKLTEACRLLEAAV